MATQQESLGTHVILSLDNGETREAIETRLMANGHDEKFVRELVSEASKLRNARRRAQGLSLILGGALVCFLSFLLTITSSFTQGSFPYVLYGLTTMGIIVVFTGFMKVF